MGRCTGILSFAFSKYKPVPLWLMLIAASCTWQWKPCKPTWKWPICQQGPIWELHSTKCAKVCIRTWVKAIFAGKLFGRTKSCHQPFVHCRVHEWRTHKVRYQNRQTMQVNGFQNANQWIVQMFPSKPLGRIVYGLWSSPDKVFSIRYIHCTCRWLYIIVLHMGIKNKCFET